MMNNKTKLLMVSIFIVIACAHLHMSGIHDMDISHNVMILNSCDVLGINMGDRTTAGVIMTSTDIYLMGIQKANMSFMAVAATCVFVGYQIRRVEKNE